MPQKITNTIAYLTGAVLLILAGNPAPQNTRVHDDGDRGDRGSLSVEASIVAAVFLAAAIFITGVILNAVNNHAVSIK